MSRRSFIDLTALLDVMLILFFTLMLNMAQSAQVVQADLENLEGALNQEVAALKSSQAQVATLEEAKVQLENQFNDAKEELESIYGRSLSDVKDYQDIISRISVIDVNLKGNQNQVYINDQDTGIAIVIDALNTLERKQKLTDRLTRALDQAIENRDKSSILFIKVRVADTDVYKYAYDYINQVVKDVAKSYGDDKVMISKQFY